MTPTEETTKETTDVNEDAVTTALTYEDLAEKHDADLLVDLSRSLAFRGDSWGATSALLASDLFVLSGLLHIHESVAGRTLERSQDEGTATNAQEFVEQVRKDLLRSIPLPLRSDFLEKVADSSFLRGLQPPSEEDNERSTPTYNKGLFTDEFIDERVRDARVLYAASAAAESVDLPLDALRANYAADVAVFESYVVALSQGAGDDMLASASLRYALAGYLLSNLSITFDDDGGFETAIKTIRSALTKATLVGPDVEPISFGRSI